MPMRRCEMQKVLQIYGKHDAVENGSGRHPREEFHSRAFTRSDGLFRMVQL
jgi:hypothetical protein